MEKWEYLRVEDRWNYAIEANGTKLGNPKHYESPQKGGYPAVDDYIARLGEQGWELVSAMTVSAIGDTRLFFKRPKQ